MNPVVLVIVLIWLCLILMFGGLGLLLRRAFGLEIGGADQWFSCFWLGWAGSLGLLQLWHLGRPIEGWALALLALGGLAGLIWCRGGLLRWMRRLSARHFAFCAALLVLAFWLADRSTYPTILYDDGLYHLTSVRWATSYPVVPGLGNLHARLALNSSYYLYVALLEKLRGFGGPYHLAGGLVIFMALAQILWNGWKLVEQRQPTATQLFSLLLLPAALRYATGPFVASASPDMAVFVLGIVLLTQLLQLLTDAPKSAKETDFLLVSIAIVATAGITVKLSAVALGVTAMLLATWAWAARLWRVGVSPHHGTFLWLGASMCLLLVPWMARGVVMSGYIVFPSTLGAFPVRWLVPHASADDTANWARSWARAPGVHWSQVLGNWDWLGPWLHRTLRSPGDIFDVVVPVLLAAVGCGAVLILRRSALWRADSRGLSGLLLLPLIASLAYWFVIAPDPRFAGAAFAALGATGAAWALFELGQSRKVLAVAVAVCLAGILSAAPVLHLIWTNQLRVGAAAPGAEPQASLGTFVTRDGLVLYVPKEGDQCWDAPLPCTPFPNAELQLIQEGDMRSGFMVPSP